MRHLTGPLARLTDPANVCGSEDYIWATLTDETPVPDAMARLRAAYPNAMKLDYAPRNAAPTAPPAPPHRCAAAALPSCSGTFLPRCRAAPPPRPSWTH